MTSFTAGAVRQRHNCSVPFPKDFSRVYADGRAFAGSQRQIQTYVNERTSELNTAIKSAVHLPNETAISWVSPLASDLFNEYRDEEFLNLLGLSAHSSALAAFWPYNGPCWDALAKINSGNSGFILVEAKSHVPEMESRCTARGAVSLAKIRKAVAETQQWLGVEGNPDWLNCFYQMANRLAFLYFLRERVKCEAWLVNVYFCNDPWKPTSSEEWEYGLAQAKKRLCLTHVAFAADVYLPAI